ncbi:MAG TPA: hypothetical protein VGJ02_06635 [Pyrinomonadaceae bacterium]|jgi:hypothetical protein
MTGNTSGDFEISQSVLIERINERLTTDSQDLKESRMSESPSLGHFYEHPDAIAEGHGTADLESIGRELGVLHPDETVTPDN